MLWPGPVGVNSGVFGNSINLAVDRHQYCTSTHFFFFASAPSPSLTSAVSTGLPGAEYWSTGFCFLRLVANRYVVALADVLGSNLGPPFTANDPTLPGFTPQGCTYPGIADRTL